MTVWDMEWFSERAEQAKRTTWIPWKSRKRPRRAILKDGYTNVRRKNLASLRWWRYLQDIFTTLLDAQWRWTLAFIALEFFGSWLSFALIWYLIAFVHGDLQEDHLPDRQADTGWIPCVCNINSFHSAFLYSLETQHTTGYGLRVITEECPEAIFIMVCQCLIGMTLDSFAISIVFAKLIRSKHATHTVQFSRNAVVSRRDGKLCFMFRVGDLRKSILAGVGIRAILVKTERSREGELMQSYQTELELKVDEGSSNAFLIWPLTVYHEIDENSPLHDFVVPDIMKSRRIEIIAIMNATVESTGVSFEAKSSYLASEILWGHMFDTMVSFNKLENRYEVDWGKFDITRSIHACRQEELEEKEADSYNQESKLLNEDDDDDDDDDDHDEVEIFPGVSLREELMQADEEIETSLPSYRKPDAPGVLKGLKGDKNRSYFRNGRQGYYYPKPINKTEEKCKDLEVTLV